MVETIGFTGTRDGMTVKQISTVIELVGLFWTDGARRARHGVCTGADDDFHVIVTNHGGYISIGHPGINNKGKCPNRGLAKCDIMLPEKPYIERDHDIVDDSDVLIATPKGMQEELRSGTWATVRYARRIGKRHIIVWPDGSSSDSK